MGCPEQDSTVPLPTIPSPRKVPARLRKAEGGVLRLQATQVEEQSSHELLWGPCCQSERVCVHIANFEVPGHERLDVHQKVEALGVRPSSPGDPEPGVLRPSSSLQQRLAQCVPVSRSLLRLQGPHGSSCTLARLAGTKGQDEGSGVGSQVGADPEHPWKVGWRGWARF